MRSWTTARTTVRSTALALGLSMCATFAAAAGDTEAIQTSSMASLVASPQPSGGRASSIVFGHNLTPTTHTLPMGVWTLGNFALGYGVTDQLTLATSPWLLHSYNMYSALLGARGRIDQKHDWSVQGAYFKTDRFYPDAYQMEALSGSLTIKREIAAYYTVNLSANYMYFFDETLPFSLRREPFNNDAWQMSLSTLQEIQLPGGFGVLVEGGFLGLNYTYPLAHIGLSMSYRTNALLLQAGVSQSAALAAANGVYTQGQSQLAHRQAGQDYDSTMHPEIHLQLFY